MNGTFPKALLLLPVLLLTGCVSPPDGDEGQAAPSWDGTEDGPGRFDGVATDRGERGGPVGGDLEVGLVRTEATANDTIELLTGGRLSEPAGDNGAVAVDWTSRLSITFTSAERSGDDVVFDGTAAYLYDKGAYLVHSKDFTVLVPDEEEDQEGGGFTSYTAADGEVLAELTPEEPTADFSVAIAGVPEEDGAQVHEDGLTGRYIRYETPAELWGHTVEPPADSVPGRLCYAEGDDWHGVELFEQPSMPCG
ncbi:hypothetical protein [Nocardiopsis halophila]|uniref:hypothetical protein n=1 Tax=Nocardiopsis halophila TaxID=141692 RepID=UPI0003480805|nr:hypothetical protein [Nocardiopsis halophila]